MSFPNRLRFNLSASDIANQSEELIQHVKKALDQIANIPSNERTFENTVQAFSTLEGEFSSSRSNLDFPAHVSTSKEVRDASNDAANKLDAARVEMYTRADIYQAMVDYKEKHADEVSKFSPEESRLLNEIIRDYKRNGMALDAQTRDKVKEIKSKMSELKNKFQQNLNEDVTKLHFTKEELEGLPDDFIEGLTTVEEEGQKKYVLSLKYPELLPTLQRATREETRKRMDYANSRKCVDVNTPLLEQILLLRQEEASLLGYSTPAEYVLEIQMAKNPAAVQSFLQDLTGKLEEPARKDVETLLRLKKEDCEKNNRPFDGKLNIWDWRYYETILLERDYQVDHNKIKEYFPLDKVTSGLLKIYQNLLGLRFVPLSVSDRHVWHEDVEQYRVEDASSGHLVGHFYLDLFPRDGKYGHAAEFGLLQGYQLGMTSSSTSSQETTRQYPAAAMVANFTKPTATKPSLLLFNEVETYFHEFGHVMHEICSQARFPRFAGTNVQRDFVEAPSQMLENWCYEAEVLKELSGHYQNPEQTLPEELRQNLINAKNVLEAFKNRRQLFFGTFDMQVHTMKGPIDTAALWAKLIKEIALTECQPNTNGAATFGHIVGGYEAGYYSYLWSKVYSSDMFKLFKEQGVLNSQLGRRYRDIILAKGGTQDAMELVVEFLGREPTADAFLEQIGAK